MFQNHAPGNHNFEALVLEDEALRHVWFDYNSGRWNVGEAIGSGVQSEAAFFQNQAPGIFNYEAVVLEGDMLRHYWFSFLERRWRQGSEIDSGVGSRPAAVQDASSLDYHVVARIDDRLGHHVFRAAQRRWEKLGELGERIAGPAALVPTRAGDLHVVVSDGDRLSHYLFEPARAGWRRIDSFGSAAPSDVAPAVFQNHAPGNESLEVVVQNRGRLRHYWFDASAARWMEGESFGADVRGAPAFFQNHAPGNFNYELVVREADALQHYWFNLFEKRWHAAARFGALVESAPQMFQNHAPGNLDYELIALENGRVQHHRFDFPALTWRTGQSFATRKLRLTPPAEPVFVSSYSPMPLVVGAGLDVNDVEVSISTQNRHGSCVSLATHPETGAPELIFLAGTVAGRYEVVATEKSSGATLDRVPVQISDYWPAGQADGPPLWVGSDQKGFPGGALFGSSNDAPTVTGDVKPVSGALKAVVLFVDTKDQRYSAQEIQDATNWWTEACSSTTDWSASRYWLEVSYGKVSSLATSIHGAFNLSQGWSHFFLDQKNKDGTWARSEHKSNVLQASVTAAQTQVDFDGIDIVICVSRNPDGTRFTWPKAEWDVNLSFTNSGGKKKDTVVGFVSMPYNWGQGMGTPQSRHRTLASTLCHELGHALRLGDIYAWSGHPQHIQDRALGGWDLMARQNELAHLIAVSRQEFGWIDVQSDTKRFNFKKSGRTDEVVTLCPVERVNAPPGSFKAVEILVADQWSVFFEYRLAQTGQIGDQDLPAKGRVLITDALRIKDYVGAQRRKPKLLAYKDQEGDGPHLGVGDEWRITDHDHLPAEFAAKVIAADKDKAEVRITYGVNSKPDPALLPWDTNTWQSASIEVRNKRNQADPKWKNVPHANAINTLVAKVQNNSDVAAPKVAVTFWVKDYNVGGGARRRIQRVVGDVPANGTGELIAQDAWMPGKAGHYCVVAEIEPYYVPGTNPPVLELSGLNNLTQSNYDRFISKSSSPVTRERTTVVVDNPFSEPTTVTLHAMQRSPLYRTLLSARSVTLGAGERREIDVLMEYGTDESQSRVTEDEREAFIGLPNDVSIWATAGQPEGPEDPPILLGGAALQVVTGRATRFSHFGQRGGATAGKIVTKDDGRGVSGGHVVITSTNADGQLESYSDVVSANGGFLVPFPPDTRRARADYVPADGYGESSTEDIAIDSA